MTMSICPHIPVGGLLQHVCHQLEKIADDKWVLQTLKENLKLEFLNFPIQTDLCRTNAKFCILEEVKKILEKGVIEPVPFMKIQNGFNSTFLL